MGMNIDKHGVDSCSLRRAFELRTARLCQGGWRRFGCTRGVFFGYLKTVQNSGRNQSNANRINLTLQLGNINFEAAKKTLCPVFWTQFVERENPRRERKMVQVVYDATEIDFARPGKQHYQLAFHLDSNWGYSLVPLTVINGLNGLAEKSVVAIGGTHGNEYEGQVSVKRLSAMTWIPRPCADESF